MRAGGVALHELAGSLPRGIGRLLLGLLLSMSLCFVAAQAPQHPIEGFFPKSAAPELLVQAIRLVRAGGVYVPEGAMADFQDGLPPARTDAAGLTPRQMDVLRQLMRGQPNKLIARDLRLTEGTVKIHIAAILRVLQARNRTEAVVRARELGLDDA